MLPRESAARERIVGIIGGGGDLPRLLRAHLEAQGVEVRTILLAGEAREDQLAEARHAIGDAEGILRSIERLGVNELVLIGWVRRRPRWRSIRIGPRTIRAFPKIAGRLASGDDALLNAVADMFESRGVAVRGIHEVWPDLLLAEGSLTKWDPDRNASRSIELAWEAALALGRLDIGQAAIAVGRRVVALEGAEGTDDMLERVRFLRQEGRIPAKKAGGVLVKVCKPHQDVRADLPTIGRMTVERAAAAGLSGIVGEAGRTLIVDRQDTIALADRLGVFLVGKSDGAPR